MNTTEKMEAHNEWKRAEKTIIYACPAYKCETISKGPGICPVHGIKLVRSVVKKSSLLVMSNFWVTGVKPLSKKKKSLKELL